MINHRQSSDQGVQARAFMHDIDRVFPNTAWAGGCKSWYLDARGHNIALWVGPSLAYRWRLWRARTRDYVMG